jgi:8-oxo-dGTP pyrophosphatase MutT (NUDIX family)
MKKHKHRTVRCILKQEGLYFLVMHQTRVFSGKKRWGFPGGRIERGEELRKALTRELREELYISIADFSEVGDYRYKGYHHRIYGSEYSDPIIKFDRSEIHKVGWHSIEEIRKFSVGGLLHTGFELEAIRDFEKLRLSP